MARKVWIIRMETRSYTFTAAGITEAEALGALKRRYDQHINKIPMSKRGDALTWDQILKQEGVDPVDYFDTTTQLMACGKAYKGEESEAKT